MSDTPQCNRCALVELAAYARGMNGVVVIHPRLPTGHPLHVPLPPDPQGFGPPASSDPCLAAGYDVFIRYPHAAAPAWVTWVMSLDARCICGAGV